MHNIREFTLTACDMNALVKAVGALLDAKKTKLLPVFEITLWEHSSYLEFTYWEAGIEVRERYVWSE